MAQHLSNATYAVRHRKPLTDVEWLELVWKDKNLEMN